MSYMPKQQAKQANAVPGDEEPISSVKVTKRTRKLLLAVSRLAGMTSVHHFFTKFLDEKLDELSAMGIIPHEQIAEVLFSPLQKRK